MKILRMKQEYIEWTIQEKKTATTRKTMRGHDKYELATGDLYHPKRKAG